MAGPRGTQTGSSEDDHTQHDRLVPWLSQLPLIALEDVSPRHRSLPALTHIHGYGDWSPVRSLRSPEPSQSDQQIPGPHDGWSGYNSPYTADHERSPSPYAPGRSPSWVSVQPLDSPCKDVSPNSASSPPLWWEEQSPPYSPTSPEYTPSPAAIPPSSEPGDITSRRYSPRTYEGTGAIFQSVEQPEHAPAIKHSSPEPTPRAQGYVTPPDSNTHGRKRRRTKEVHFIDCSDVDGCHEPKRLRSLPPPLYGVRFILPADYRPEHPRLRSPNPFKDYGTEEIVIKEESPSL